MNPRVTSVFPNNNFTLTIQFTNGEIGIFNMKDYLEIGIFKELKDYNLFKTVKPFLGTIQWVNGQDLCPDKLYLKSRKVPVTNLQLIINSITDLLPVSQIILFGSYAKDTQNEDSDLDLFITLDDNTNIREIDAVKMIRKVIRDKISMASDILVSKKSTFEERKNLATLDRIIYEEGIILYKK